MTDRTFTCNQCGTTGSLEWMRDHPCGQIQDVRQFGGRCEDYPCCGHAPGECEPQESHTKGYWQRIMSRPDYDPDLDIEDQPWLSREYVEPEDED